MEFGDSPREAEFRRQVRAFLQAEFLGKYSGLLFEVV